MNLIDAANRLNQYQMSKRQRYQYRTQRNRHNQEIEDNIQELKELFLTEENIDV